MLRPFKKTIPGLLLALLGMSYGVHGQTEIVGFVKDALTNRSLPHVKVVYLWHSELTDDQGRFAFIAPRLEQEVVLTFERSGYQFKTVHFLLSGQSNINIGDIPLQPQDELDQFDAEDFIPTITFELAEDQQVGGESISGLLTASRDIFVSTAAYHFGAARFRLRGYHPFHTQVYFNGVPVNDPETGFVAWSHWSGLNDVIRNRSNTVGLAATPFAFGGVGGASTIDTRASRMRRQLRVSYALSNRAYNNRVMGTLSTGNLPGGWSFALSGSRRWAEEGYVPGTFHDAYSFFASAGKRIGANHELNLTVLGAPLRQGRAGSTTQEMYDLGGTNFYNPHWGYQSGRKRNARTAFSDQPMVFLRHDWRPSSRSRLTSAAAYQMGRNGVTAIDWYDARDPRPDYYRRLPSFISNEQRERVEDELRNNEDLRQIDWSYIYDVNRHSMATVLNADGVEGNTISGRRAQYVLEERRFDSRRLHLYTNLETVLNDQFTLHGGLAYQQSATNYFKVLEDLLGAEFYLDIDKFAEFDRPGDAFFIQNDLDRPNRLLREGDRFGYDYELRARRGEAWLQGTYATRKADFFLALNANLSQFRRVGMMRNGKFPDDSEGPSDLAFFFNYGAKGGVTVKVDGRNYLVFNGAYLTRAPFARDAFLSPRTRNQMVDDLSNERVTSAEAIYYYRGPYAKLRVGGYFTRFDNQFSNRSFYLDNAILTETGAMRGGFVNYIMRGIDTQHLGVEAAGELPLTGGLRFNAAASLGQFIHVSRPEVTVVLDQQAEVLRSYTAYLRNFYVPNTPQTAMSAGLSYNSAQFWFANLNLNYFDRIWMDFNPERRTVAAISYATNPQYSDQVVQPGSDLWKSIIYQEKAPASFTVDFFGGKSFKFNRVFLYLTVGVNNVLDNQNFIIGGYEQFRFDFRDKNVDRFPNRYVYGFGRNYFLQAALRI
jgi:hypothetical protein